MFHQEYDEEDYVEYEPPKPKRRASQAYDLPTEQIAPPRHTEPPRRKRKRSLTPVGGGMLLVVLLLVLWNLVVIPWWHGLEVQWHYGDNRVSVFGADVGHGGVSRFIAFEDGAEIVVVEVVNRKYTIMTIAITAKPNQLITLSIADVNGDGKPDLVVHLDGEQGSFALINTGKAFATSK